MTCPSNPPPVMPSMGRLQAAVLVRGGRSSGGAEEADPRPPTARPGATRPPQRNQRGLAKTPSSNGLVAVVHRAQPPLLSGRSTAATAVGPSGARAGAPPPPPPPPPSRLFRSALLPLHACVPVGGAPHVPPALTRGAGHAAKHAHRPLGDWPAVSTVELPVAAMDYPHSAAATEG